MDRAIPQDNETEKQLLGLLINLENDYGIPSEVLKPDLMYSTKNRRILLCIIDILTTNDPVNVITVTEKLKEKGWFDEIGNSYLINLYSHVTSKENISFLTKSLINLQTKRSLIGIFSKYQNLCFEPSSKGNGILADTFKNLYEIDGSINNKSKDFYEIKELVTEQIDNVLAKKENPDIDCIPTGLSSLDDLLNGGFPKSDLIVIGARPSDGKTSIANTFTLHQAINLKLSVGFISIEMSAPQIQQRLLSTQSGMSSHKIRRMDIERAELPKLLTATTQLTESRIYLNDNQAITDLDIRLLIMRNMRKYNFDIIYIDFLQLIRSAEKYPNRNLEIGGITASLKALVKELGIPIVLLSQLSRDHEKTNKRPTSLNLRDSGEIEQVVDIIMLLYHPDKLSYREPGYNNPEPTVEIIVDKNRNGGTGSVNAGFRKYCTKFIDRDDSGQVESLFETAGEEMPF